MEVSLIHYLIIGYILLSMVLGAIIANRKGDFATRGAVISLFGGLFGPICIYLSHPSKAREGDKNVWPENAPIGVILNFIIVFAIVSVRGRILAGYILLSMVLGAIIANRKGDLATRGAVIGFFSGLFGPIFMYLSHPIKARESDKNVWPENATIGVILNFIIVFAIVSVLGRILARFLILASIGNIVNAAILQSVIRRVGKIEIVYKETYWISFIVVIYASLVGYIGDKIIVGNFFSPVNLMISLALFILNFLILSTIFSAIKDPQKKQAIGLKRGCLISIVYLLIGLIITGIIFALVLLSI